MRTIIAVSLIMLGLGFVVVSQAEEEREFLVGHPWEGQERKLDRLFLHQSEPSVPQITFSVTEPEPFGINQSAVRILDEMDQKIAEEKLTKAKAQLAELILMYPNTDAAEEARDILDKSGLKVYSNGAVLEKGFFETGGVLITR